MTEEAGVEEKRDLRLRNRVRRQLKDFNKNWGDVVQLILSISAVLFGVVLVVISLLVLRVTNDNSRRGKEAKDNAKAANLRSKGQCNRSKLIGPYLVKDYEMRQVMPESVLSLYKSTIPKKC